MKRLLAVAVLMLFLAALSPSAGAVTRHPSKFSGAPLVDGYLPIRLGGEAALYYRVLAAVVRIASLYNVTDIVVSHVSCAIYTDGNNTGMLYSATIQAWNRATGDYIVVTTGPGPGASTYIPLNTPISVNIANTSLRLKEPDQDGLRVAGALDKLALTMLNITEPKHAFPVARLLSPQDLPPADTIRGLAIRLNNVSLTVTYSILQGPGNYTQLYSLCQLSLLVGGSYAVVDEGGNRSAIVIGGGGFPVVAQGTILDTRSLSAAMIGGLSAVASPASSVKPGVLIVPLINSTSLLLALQLYGLGVGPGNTTIVNPPVNVTIEEIRNTIANGTEKDALQAIQEAKKLAEKGVITVEDLQKLRELFKKRFGYDPLEQGGQQGQPHQPVQQTQNTGGPKPAESVALDLDKLLQSLQSLQQEGAQGGPGGGAPQLPQLRVRLPGAEQALRASLLFTLVAALGLAYSERERIALTARALICRPPPGLDEKGAAEWSYLAALRLLELRGMGKAPWETPREYLARIGPLLGEAAGSLEELTTAYERAVYRMEKVPRSIPLGACRRLATMLRNPLYRPWTRREVMG